MEIIRRQSIMNLSSFQCFVRQLTASFMNREWGWAEFCVEYGAVSDRADVDRRARIFVHEQGFMEIIRRRSMMNFSSFHCFVRFPCRVATQARTSDKKSITQITAQGNEMLGLDGSSSRQQLMLEYNTEAGRKTWYRNLEYSTESEPEEKKARKPGCSCSAKWKLGWGNLFDPSVLSRCGSIQRRYDAKFV